MSMIYSLNPRKSHYFLELFTKGVITHVACYYIWWSLSLSVEGFTFNVKNLVNYG